MKLTIKYMYMEVLLVDGNVLDFIMHDVLDAKTFSLQLGVGTRLFLNFKDFGISSNEKKHDQLPSGSTTHVSNLVDKFHGKPRMFRRICGLVLMIRLVVRSKSGKLSPVEGGW